MGLLARNRRSKREHSENLEYAISPKNLTVLDLSVLRPTENVLQDEITRARVENTRFLLPPFWDVDLLKAAGEHWPSTLRRSCELMANAPELFFVAAHEEILDFEQRSRSHCSHPISAQKTQLFHDFLRRDISSDASVKKFFADRGKATFGLAENKQAYLESTKATLSGIVANYRDILEQLPSDLNRLRNEQDETTTELAATFTLGVHCRDLASSWADQGRALRFMCSSYTGRMKLMVSVMALDEIAMGGTETKPPGYAANDFFDAQLVVFGTMCNRLLSKERQDGPLWRRFRIVQAALRLMNMDKLVLSAERCKPGNPTLLNSHTAS